MPQNATKNRQKPPKARSLYTPEPVRGRVIARHVTGESNRQIATAEKIDRETVGRILSLGEVAELMGQYRSRLLCMVPKAIDVYEEALASDDERVRVAAATKLLEGMGVLSKGAVDQPPPEPDRRQQKTLVLGQLMELMLSRHEQFGMPLPAEFDGVEDQLAKRLGTPTG